VDAETMDDGIKKKSKRKRKMKRKGMDFDPQL
jgi:hypothetical protein